MGEEGYHTLGLLYHNLAGMQLNKKKITVEELKELKQYIVQLEVINEMEKNERRGYLIELLKIRYLIIVDKLDGLLPRIKSLIEYFTQRNDIHKLSGMQLAQSTYFQKKALFERSIKVAKEGMTLTKENDLLNQHANFLEHISSVYKDAGNFEEALFWFEKFHTLENELKSEEVGKQSAVLNERLNTLQKESELKLLTSENAQQSYRILMLTSTFLSLTLILVAIYIKANARRKTVERESRYKSKFLSALSHEIRNPLNSIVGVSQLYSHELNKSERMQLMDILKSSSEVLLGLVNEVLDLSKIEAGEANLKLESASLVDVLDNVVMTMSPMATQQGNAISLLVDKSVPERLLFDASKLSQVIINILSNGIKNTENGVITIACRYQNEQLELSIEDTGVGIEKSEIDNIFKPFRQLEHESDNIKFRSTGLGLAITTEILSLMKGKVKVDSELNQGTRFSLTFPLQKCDTDSEQKLSQFIWLYAPIAREFSELEWRLSRLGYRVQRIQNQKDLTDKLNVEDELLLIASTVNELAELNVNIPVDMVSNRIVFIRNLVSNSKQRYKTLVWPFNQTDFSFSLTGKEREEHLRSQVSVVDKIRVLVVDDDATSRQIVTRMFTKLGADCDTAVNGEKAVDLVLKNNYQLVVLDSIMPVMGGGEASKVILSNSQIINKPIIIGLSGNAAIEDIESCLNAGMKSCLVKPIKLNELQKVLELVNNCGSSGGGPT